MPNYSALIKHYRNYPGKVLPSFHQMLALEHISPRHATAEEIESLKSLSNDEQPSDGPTDAQQALRTSWLKIATSDVDRAGDTLQLDGMDATDFLANPQLLWMHGLTPLPVHTIGRIVKVVTQEDAIYALAEYAPPELYPFADQIYQLDAAGFLPANSIGFHPIEWEKNEYGGFDFIKWELIECSKVELPMNPYAVNEGVPVFTSLQARYCSTEEAARWLN